MTDYETARFVANAADAAAKRSRAFRRGNVDRVESDGRLVITLPNGAKVLRPQSQIAPLSPGQSALLIGQTMDPLAPNPYGGGLGSPYDAP